MLVDTIWVSWVIYSKILKQRRKFFQTGEAFHSLHISMCTFRLTKQVFLTFSVAFPRHTQHQNRYFRKCLSKDSVPCRLLIVSDSQSWHFDALMILSTHFANRLFVVSNVACFIPLFYFFFQSLLCLSYLVQSLNVCLFLISFDCFVNFFAQTVVVFILSFVFLSIALSMIFLTVFVWISIVLLLFIINIHNY